MIFLHKILVHMFASTHIVWDEFFKFWTNGYSLPEVFGSGPEFDAVLTIGVGYGSAYLMIVAYENAVVTQLRSKTVVIEFSKFRSQVEFSKAFSVVGSFF